MSFQFEEHLVAPRVFWNGRWHARDAVAAQAGAWAERLSSFAEQPASGSYAVALPHGPEGTALFLAVLTTPAVPVLLSFEPDAWPYAAELRTGMALVLPPSLAELAPEAERRGYRPIVLTHGHSDGGRLRGRGCVLHCELADQAGAGKGQRRQQQVAHHPDGALVRQRELRLHQDGVAQQ